MRINPAVSLLVALSFLACGGSARDLAASARFELTQPPAGAACVQLTIKGGAQLAKESLSLAGGTSNLTVAGVPTGPVAITGSAYNVACESVTAATKANWVVVPVIANFTASGPNTAAITLRAPIARTPLLDVAFEGSSDKQIHLWVADIGPGASTGKHAHPTQRFVYVLEGAVTFAVDGQPAQTYQAGQAYQELPGIVHDFSNASATEPARALGVQIAATGQPLQY